MPLTAEYRATAKPDEDWELTDVTLYKQPRIELAEYDLRCPECHRPMHVRGGVLKIFHFAHNPKSANGDALPDCALRRGETMRHLIGKTVVAKRIAELSAYAGGVQVIKEVWMPDISRRCDLMVNYAEGGFDIHEVQLASITTKELYERTKDYIKAGAVEVVWWFGGSADTADNRKWANEYCGGYGTISFTESALEGVEDINW